MKGPNIASHASLINPLPFNPYPRTSEICRHPCSRSLVHWPLEYLGSNPSRDRILTKSVTGMRRAKYWKSNPEVMFVLCHSRESRVDKKKMFFIFFILLLKKYAIL